MNVGRITPLIVCNVISIVAVALRFWCKYTLKAGFHGDDLWILITLLSFIGGEIALVWGIIHGSRDGATIGEINEQLQVADDPELRRSLETFLRSIFVALTISFFVVYAIKIAILLLYRRIFSTPRYQLASNILIGISTAWFIGVEVTNLVHCRPIESFWTNYEDGECLNFNLLFLIAGVVEIVIDVCIIILPMIGTYFLQTNHRTKLLVSGIFLLGWFSIITNILRVYYTYQPEGRFVDLAGSELWTVIHIASAVLCASLPVYKPIRKSLSAATQSLQYFFSSSRQYMSSRSAKSSRVTTEVYPMDSVRAGSPPPTLRKPVTRSQESMRDLLQTGPQDEPRTSDYETNRPL
ncbi:hypothetical protein B0I35DRAFT_485348 [Stachybotrys elegans]|uniref:Rhodopsin domain-containing protein n=1 Tax=Stachybotrys elegans TaxID=80388 RepID=A0A8K0WJA0_9HYPO|nr:hypothetical protein B0I35DRAFT_485348 [Stachybotrys elegans]